MENLVDPLADRVRKDVPMIVTGLHLPSSDVWLTDDKPNLPRLRNHLLGEGLLSAADTIKLCRLVTASMSKKPNLAIIERPCMIVGDIHGHFYDMIHMFDLMLEHQAFLNPKNSKDKRKLNDAGKSKKLNLLFLGDYVDRGYYDVEVIIFLFALYLNFPK